MSRLRLPMFYLVGGLSAALFQVIVDSRAATPMIGASGAISGIMGTYLMRIGRRQWRRSPGKRSGRPGLFQPRRLCERRECNEMRVMRLILACAAGACLLLLVASYLSAQIPSSIPYTGQYNRGQDVVPVYEGWKPNPDGTFTMYFGYFNRNYQEELDIPLGPNNSIDPGGDRGQPTHFYPRRHLFVFKVVVPKDWGFERRVIWTLNLRGKANTAKGWLKAEWEINDEVMMENRLLQRPRRASRCRAYTYCERLRAMACSRPFTM